ncbi:MAG: hypothetical protein HQ541_16055, partial [Mariniphaga sp.]|nr:hypothetical protein [Mariniphaga sp.]
MKNLSILIILVVISLNVQSQQLHDYNPYDSNISDNCSNAQSDLKLSGAPYDAVINGVNLYFEINHPKHSDLKIWITSYYSNSWHDVILYNQGSLQSTGLLKISKTNITQWNGASPNQTWYLVAKDCVTGNVGYISFFELWVNYNSPPVLGIIDGSKDFGDVGLGTNPSVRSFPITIKNTGQGILIGTIVSQDSWLALSSTSFSLTENQTKTFTITATTSSLSAGSYTGYLKITSNGGGATHPAAMVNIVSPDLGIIDGSK